VVAQLSGPPIPETLRADQRARRDKIVRAGLRALGNGDYERLKVSEIAKESGVALGTLYRYFASKEHLFAAVFYEWQNAMKRNLDKVAPKGTESEQLQAILARTVRSFQVQPQYYRVLLMLQTTSDHYAAEIYVSLNGVFQEILASAIEGPLDADHQAILRTLTSVLDQGLRGWVMGRERIEDVYLGIDEAIRLIYQFPPAKRSRARS
jgi:AcrR family transcriptional regulator